jgi:heat shock protein HslJ
VTRTTKTLALVILTLAAGLVLAGCATGGSLDGTSWRLSSWTVSSIDPAQVTITAKFAGGQMSGSGGVNTYSGPYKTGPGNAFAAGPLASTLMAGADPAQRAETAFFTMLGQAASYKVEDRTLTLFDEGGNPSLIFTKAK